MPDCSFIDLAGGAFALLDRTRALPLPEQLAAWHDHYERVAADLLRKCTDSYEAHGHDWRAVAAQHVWPRLRDDLPLMKAARDSARDAHEPVYGMAVASLGLDFPVVFVAYVGVGCGAGWATEFRDTPAVLIGLENVAQLRWHRPSETRKLLAHELGHLFMNRSRRALPPLPDDPLCSLFEEGFAQHCEHLILGGRTWGCASQPGWLEWCTANEGRLAADFLAHADDAERCRRFFGSWFDVDGWRQTGYFLGCRLVESLARSCSVHELAVLSPDEIRTSARRYLESAAPPAP